MIPHEEFRLARIYVRVMRVITNVALFLSAIAGVGWACYVIVAAISDFWNHSENREELRQRVLAIPAEREQRVAALAGEEAQEAQRLEQEIESSNSNWQAEAAKFNELVKSTADMVKKAEESAPSAVTLSVDAMTTPEACAAAQPGIQQAESAISGMKQSLYAGMESDIAAMERTVQGEKSRLENEIRNLQLENERHEAEINQIKAKYKDKREVVTVYQQKDALLADHCVYDLRATQGEDVAKHARELSSVGFMLPALANRLVTPNYLLSKDMAKPLYTRASRLSAWLPMLVAGGTVEERSEEEIPMTPLVLSEDDSKRVAALSDLCDANNINIRNLNRELSQCETELQNLAQTRKDIEATKSVVLSNWKIDPAIGMVRSAHNKVKTAVNNLATLRETYRNKKSQLITRYEDEVRNCHKQEELYWKTDCATVMFTIRTQLWLAAVPIISGWLLWVILMTIIDFAAAILVGALRAQAAHELLEEKKEA